MGLRCGIYNLMSLKEYLLADLERQFFYHGQPERLPTILGIWKRSLHPRFFPVVLFRLAHSCHCHGWGAMAKVLSLVNFVLFGIEIAVGCKIGGGLFLPHTVGTVIGARSIGKNAVIFSGVTLGSKVIDIGYHLDTRPMLGDNVMVGSGAKVLGWLEIGDNVTVGANAVVTKSIESNVLVVGIPAKILQQKDNHGSNS
jgi:serine O-acetyltransferase